MPLTPQAESFLLMVAQAGLPPVEQCTPEENRANMSSAVQPVEAVESVKDRMMAGPESEIRLRIYRPAGATFDTAGKLPGIVFYHGGGWVVGSIESHDGLCRMFANRAGSVVVSVDYRLAPEHKFPAAAEDAYAAACWTARNADELGIDVRRLVVAGDSAGGNLAAVVSMLARDRGFPDLACQILLYPVTDRDFSTSSYLRHAEGCYLTRAAMIWFFEQYVGGTEASEINDDRLTPLRAKDLSKLPPAVILSAEFDPLCDEAIAFGQRLAAEGIPVIPLSGQGLLHGFLRRPDFFPEAETMLCEICNSFHQLLQYSERRTEQETSD